MCIGGRERRGEEIRGEEREDRVKESRGMCVYVGRERRGEGGEKRQEAEGDRRKATR